MPFIFCSFQNLLIKLITMKKLFLLSNFVLFCFTSYGQILEKDLTIGTETDEIYFGSIQNIDVDSEGMIYVSDWDTRNIRVFNKKGAIQNTIGRPGRGPGEFQKIDGTGLTNEGLLHAYDPNLVRVSVFDVGSSSNVLLKTLKIPKLETNTEYGARPRGLYVYNEDKKFLLQYTTPYSPGTGRMKRKEKLVLFDEAGDVVKQPLLTLREDQNLVRDQGGGLSVGPMPFGRKSLVEIGPTDQIYTAWTNELAIKIYNDQGEYLSSITKKVSKVNVSSSDLEQKNEEVSSFNYSNFTDQIPDTWPAFDWFEVDDKSRIWVAVNTEDLQKHSLRIYNQNGDLLSKTAFPQSVELKDISDGYAYGIQQGKNDLESVVRYKINFDSK